MEIDFKSMNDEIVKRGKIRTLDNGITIISENVPHLNLTKGNIMINAGAFVEAPEHNGMMHFLEHVSFNHSRKFKDRTDRDMQASLISLAVNANTNLFDVTYPIIGNNNSGYLLKNNFYKAAEIVSDIAFFPVIDEDSRQREFKIIKREMEERNHRGSSVYDDIYKTINKKMYGNNPIFLNNVIGTSDSLEKISVVLLKKYHSNFFVGKNTVVNLVGDLNEHRSLESDIANLLCDIPAGQRVKPQEFFSEKPLEGREVLVFPSQMENSAAVDIHFQFPNNIKERYVMPLLNYIFTRGHQSLLLNNLREKQGLVYSVSGSCGGHFKTQNLVISYSVEKDKLDQSLQIVDESLDELKKGKFSENFVDAYKADFLPNLIIALKNPGWIQSELYNRLMFEKFGYGDSIFDSLKLSSELKKQDVVDVANKYLGENRLTVIRK
jgi:predicted Zn-dependent peptidase